MKTAMLTLLAIGILFSNPAEVNAQEPILPSEEHKALKNDVGTWDAIMKLYVDGPDAEPTEHRAVETNEMLGEFWLMSRLEYEMLGQRMNGRGQFGYDPVRGKFVGTWCDSGSPYMSTLEGEWNADRKSWTYMLKGRDETGNPTAGKLVTTLRDRDHKTLTMYMVVPGQDVEYVKMMDVEYSRRK